MTSPNPTDQTRRSSVDGEIGGRDLEEFLSDLRGRYVYYCPNPGNGGDSLIALAAYELFEKLDIEYRPVAWNDDIDLTNECVIYGGGGNLVGSYPQARTFITRHHRRARRLIVFPSTIQKNEDLLGRLGANVEVIARERYTYEYLKLVAPHAKVHLMDDVAITLDARRMLDRDVPPLWSIMLKSVYSELRGRGGDAVALRTLGRCLKERARSGNSLWAPGGRVLHAFRTDREQTDIPLPDDNVDISRLFALGTHNKAVARYATHGFLAFIDQYEVVRTNRLHVCIGAALLGKEVRFYPNSYFKNAAVFEFSIRDRFPNVCWCGDA